MKDFSVQYEYFQIYTTWLFQVSPKSENILFFGTDKKITKIVQVLHWRIVTTLYNLVQVSDDVFVYFLDAIVLGALFVVESENDQQRITRTCNHCKFCKK
jgi:hypothetical protein